MKKKKKGQKINWKILLVFFLITFAVAAVGTLITYGTLNINWFNPGRLQVTPPNFIFMIIWNLLFVLIALSLYFSWIKATKKEKIRVGIVFGINFLLNMLWSVLFFSFTRPDWAFYDLVLLDVSIIITIYATWKIDKKSGYLLAPYLLWVSLATVLNYLIAFFNFLFIA